MKTIDHWKEPRKTISTDLQDNDFAYVTHGVMMTFEFLKYIDTPIKELKDKYFVDYGCGTSRMVRNMSMLFKESYGYDPVQECIDESKKELDLVNKNKSLISIDKIKCTTNFNELPLNYFDYVSSVNVFEHLNTHQSTIAINNINSLLKVGGTAILWMHVIANNLIINKYNLTMVAEGKNIQIYKYSKNFQ